MAPTATVITTRIVKIALPIITSGWRARLERRLGPGTRSGSSAARAERGALPAGGRAPGGGGTGGRPPFGGKLEFKCPLSCPPTLSAPRVSAGAEQKKRQSRSQVRNNYGEAGVAAPARYQQESTGPDICRRPLAQAAQPAIVVYCG